MPKQLLLTVGLLASLIFINISSYSVAAPPPKETSGL